ncbi:MAG: penicillin-binding protein 2, partial [Phycisphaerales bacterium]
QPARRGDLLDARGRVLATSTIGYRLFVDPTQVRDMTTIAADLAGVIDVDRREIEQRIRSGVSPQYVVIEDLLDDRQEAAVRNAGLRGVGIEPRQVRHYPHGEQAARVIGLVGFEHTGLSGSEHVYDAMLSPQKGRLTYLRDVHRQTMWIEAASYEPAADGRDVRLTIDLVVQEIAERCVLDAVRRFNAGGGRVVVLDCRTGEILAMADVLADRPGRRSIALDPARARSPSLGRNRCVTDPYEPGSTFKPFIWAAATELGYVEPGEILPCPTDRPYRTPYGRMIRDSHYLGPVSWRTVLVRSLNTGMAMVAQRMSHQEMRRAIGHYGFGRRTRCGIPGETAGLVTSAERWSDYTQSSVSFGHEIAVTPIQMVSAFSAFARGGMLTKVRIFAGPDDVQERPPFRFVNRVCSPAIADLVREILGDVMIDGTGRPAQSDRYRMFGKSGTAQLPRPEGGGYFEDRYVSSFIAGAPLADPRLVVLCVIDDPDRSLGHWGGQVAGPVVRDVIDGTLAYLGVGPEEPLE